jgi:hypothetical protein
LYLSKDFLIDDIWIGVWDFEYILPDYKFLITKEISESIYIDDYTHFLERYNYYDLLPNDIFETYTDYNDKKYDFKHNVRISIKDGRNYKPCEKTKQCFEDHSLFPKQLLIQSRDPNIWKHINLKQQSDSLEALILYVYKKTLDLDYAFLSQLNLSKFRCILDRRESSYSKVRNLLKILQHLTPCNNVQIKMESYNCKSLLFYLY